MYKWRIILQCSEM